MMIASSSQNSDTAQAFSHYFVSKKVDDISKHESKHDADPKHNPKQDPPPDPKRKKPGDADKPEDDGNPGDGSVRK